MKIITVLEQVNQNIKMYCLSRLNLDLHESIRDVIAFPKTQRASCLMTEAPSNVSEDQLEELQLRIRASAAKQN